MNEVHAPCQIKQSIELWATFLQQQGHAIGTRKRYCQAVSRFLGWYEQETGTALTCDQLTSSLLIAYRDSLIGEQQKAFGTVNVQVSSLRAWCGWMTEQGYYRSNPAISLKPLSRQDPVEPMTLSQTQVNALLRQAHASRDSKRNVAIVQLLLHTGVRLGECSRIMLKDITFEEHQATVLVGSLQTRNLRTIELPSPVCQALASYLASRWSCLPSMKGILSAWSAHTKDGNEPLWLSQKGGALTASAMSQTIADLVREAGALVPQETSAFTLRHTFARNYCQQRPGDLVGLANILGLTSLDAMLFVYQPLQKQECGKGKENGDDFKSTSS